MSTRIITLTTMVLFAVQVASLACGAEPAAEEKPLGRKATLFNGESLGRWKVIEKNGFEKHGEVKVANGAIAMAAGMPATGIVYSGKFPTGNYELRLEARRTAGDDFFCGLTFPIDDSHVTLILGGWGGGATGLSNLEGDSAIENETTGYVEFENNKWYEVRLRVTAAKVEAWVGAEKIVDLERTDIAGQQRKFSVWWEQEPARPLGIVSWRTAAAIRNIEFERIDK